MTWLDDLMVRPGATIKDSMRVIDEGAAGIALMVADTNLLIGTISDGDLRRALLSGSSLDDPVDDRVTRNPTTVPVGRDRAAVLDLMRARRLNQIPVVDDDGRVVGLHIMREVLGGEDRSNWAVVLAGGRGTRLGQLTSATPKPMLPVAGRPILERIVLHLVGSGITNIALAVSYLAEQIEDHFGDGSEFGASIHYLREDPEAPLGTGGPVRGLLHLPEPPTEPVLVMNGDLVTSFSVRAILEAHADADAAMTIALTEYAHDVPFGVAHLRESDPRLIAELAEKPRWVGLVNAGVYVLGPRLLERIPAETLYPITDLATACIERRERVCGWELRGDWHDIGRPHEFARARGEL